MNVLCLDTSSEKIALGLIKNGERLIFVSEAGSKKHNSTMLSYIDTLLHNNGLEINDIDYFGVVVGPGSFTGIRVGVATINAFALALNKPVIEIISLEQLFNNTDIMSVLDCKHNNYYCGLKIGGKIEYLALTGEEIEQYKVNKVMINDVTPELLMDKVLEKISNKQLTNQAKPFYLKRSSAERETGIEC